MGGRERERFVSTMRTQRIAFHKTLSSYRFQCSITRSGLHALYLPSEATPSPAHTPLPTEHEGERERKRIQMDVHRERLVKCYFHRRFVAFVHFASSSRYTAGWDRGWCREGGERTKKCATNTSFTGYRFSKEESGATAERPLAVSVDLSYFLGLQDAFRVDFHLAPVYKPEM